ncbi:alpha/beta fold hydrolase [Streptomyces sp. NPDC001903]|uniref:alpha/beta fold hydrolase n=1 Tax=Streptomyces sp. NPDC001903 TaxID=3364622 RepID=UPI0036B5CE35
MLPATAAGLERWDWDAPAPSTLSRTGRKRRSTPKTIRPSTRSAKPWLTFHDSFREKVEALVKAKDGFGLEKPHVVGPDIGTPAALFAAARHPDRFETPAPGPWPPARSAPAS